MTNLFANFLGPMEIVVLAVIGVILFGKRLPDVGRYLGKSITEFKKGMKGLEDDMDVTGNHSSPMAQNHYSAARSPKPFGRRNAWPPPHPSLKTRRPRPPRLRCK